MKRFIDFINEKRFEHLIKSVRFKDSVEYLSYDVRQIENLRLKSFVLYQEWGAYAYSSYFKIRVRYFKGSDDYESNIYFNTKGHITSSYCVKNYKDTKPDYTDLLKIAKEMLLLSKSNRTMIYDDKVVELGK